MSPSKTVLATALLACGLGASAQTSAAPGTGQPQSHAWGPDFRKEVQGIFEKLLLASGYDLPDALAKDHRDPTQLVYLDNARMVGGSPLVALAAKTGPNKKNHSIVAVTYGALEIGDADHVAFFMAHEIAHLVHEHPQKLARLQMDLFDKWYDANSDRFAGRTPQDAVAAFAQENAGAMGEAAKPFEREADMDGLSLMASAGFDAGKASDAMNKAQDWLWAQKLSSDDPSHDPLVVRAGQLRTQAAQMQNARARVAGVTGEPQ